MKDIMEVIFIVVVTSLIITWLGMAMAIFIAQTKELYKVKKGRDG